jgi:uncharacterized membrane protein
MAVARARHYETAALARAGILLAACTLVLTASFVGLVALLGGRTAGLTARLPVYVLGMAATFVGGIVLFETRLGDGPAVLTTAAAIAVGTFVLGLLGGEGVTYVLEHTESVVGSQLLPYVLAAGMIATGLGYWTAHHWQELPVGGGRGAGPVRGRR